MSALNRSARLGAAAGAGEFYVRHRAARRHQAATLNKTTRNKTVPNQKGLPP
jgi:hypothetical protein